MGLKIAQQLLPALVHQAATALASGVQLEVDARSLEEWSAAVDLPGPVDLRIERRDGHTLIVFDLPGDVDVVTGHGADGWDRPQLRRVEVIEPPPPAPGEPAPPARIEITESRPLLERTRLAIRRRLATGAYDDQLDELLEQERAGKARRGVLTAIQRRRSPDV